MKKASLSLLTGLITLGLLLTGRANAMTYTISGDSTTIAIPKGINGTTIKRCQEDGCETTQITDEGNGCGDNKCCEKSISSTRYIECTHKYDTSSTYTVYFDGKNNDFNNLYLDTANIKTINDYSTIGRITNLYLGSNTGIILSSNTFSNSPVTHLYLDHNDISTYGTYIPTQFNSLSLESNKLTTIPEVIRNARDRYRIKLASNKSYNPYNIQINRYIDLSNNPIKFIRIIKVNGNDTRGSSLQNPTSFERFGYSYENNNSSFDYTITGNNSSTPITGGEITTTSYTITNPLEPGNYTFKICLHNEVDTCESIKFNIQYVIYVDLDSNIEDQSTISSTDNIHFSWERRGTYPENFISGYNYILNKDGTTIYSGSTSNSSGSYILDPNLIEDNPNGNYEFRVDLINKEGNLITDANTTFTIEIPATISITSPNSPATNQPVEFAWDSFLPDFYTFTNYTYTVEKGNEVFLSGIIDNINNKSFTGDIILSDGTYTFNLTMNYNSGSVDTSKTFNINTSAGAYLNLTPNNGETIPGNHVKQVTLTPSWNGGGSILISGYSYSLTNISTSEIIDSGSIQKNDSGIYSLSEKLLPSGTYKFEVTMLDNNNNTILNESSNFTIVIPSELEILSPSEGLQTTKNITFSRLGFAEFEDHYSYQLNKIGSASPITGNNNTNTTSFTIENMANGQYTFTVSMLNSLNTAIESRVVNFSIPDSQELTINISDGQHYITTLNSRTGIFSRGGTSENFDSYSYSVEGTTFNNESYSYTGTSTSTAGEFTLNDLSTGIYRFTVTMLDSNGATITGKYLDFDVAIPATLIITSPSNGTKITSSSATFSWTGYSDVITQYKYKLISTSYSIDETFTNSTSTTVNNLKDGSYTLNVWLLSGDVIVAQDSINFTVAIPSTPSGGGGGGGGGGGSGGGSSGKTHYNNKLKLSLGNDSPSVNQWIKLIVKIDEKYTGKVFFPKIQYYSPDTEKWIDLPMTSKTYVSEYGDEAKLGYTKFTSDDDGRKNLSEFIKFSKSGYYRIYAEDKDGYDDYVEFKVSNTKNTQTPLNTSGANTTNTNNIDSIIQKYIPDIYEQQHTQEEVYVSRSCKRYTITYSDYLNAYTSPNLNVAEYFVNKDYFKRYLDSKNKYQSGCPTNIGWISTSYVDRTNDNTRYVAPNGKVYFIKGQEGNYYSSELNGNAKTPSFRTVQELKYYIRDRNPLISMAALGPTN